MIQASIDIGTNTVLLLVAEVQNYSIRPLKELQRIPRLGKGVDKSGNLDPGSMNRVIEYLLEYKEILQKEYPEVTSMPLVAATSAVRDASNRSEFLNLVKEKTGWKIRILTGSEEAKTTYEGALSVLKNRSSKGNFILDIGGGSTELAFGMGYKLQNAVSINMGSVRFTERFFVTNPPKSEQVTEVQDEIRRLLSAQQFPEGEFDLIGVAGTVTSIAAIDMGLKDYDTDGLNGYRLEKSIVQNYVDEFSVTSWEKIEKKYSVFLKGRGEVVLAGILILKEVMDWCGRDSVIVSTGGIRHGVLLNLSTK